MPYAVQLWAMGTFMTGSGSYFNTRRQSPIEHLKVLRGGSYDARNTNSYLSPALHNVSDAWVRFLRSQSHQFCDEHGVARNHALLMRKSVQERKTIHKWCEGIKTNANIFTMILRDVVALNMRKAFQKQAAGQPACRPYSLDKELQGEDVIPDTVEDWSGDFEEPVEHSNRPIEDYSANFEEESEQTVQAVAIEDWSEDFEEPDEHFARASEYSCDEFEELNNNVAYSIEDWSEDFEVTQEHLDRTILDLEPLGTSLRPTSSCSSTSTQHNNIFDTEKEYSSDDEVSIKSHEKLPIENNMCKDAIEISRTTEMPAATLKREASAAPATSAVNDSKLSTVIESAFEDEDECMPSMPTIATPSL